MDGEMSVQHKVDLERMLLDRSAEPTYLPLSLLEDITNCFSDDQQIGSGGFAVVYKGMVGKGMVAVKKLSKTFGVHENKFHTEVECLMKVKHKNIVRFLGYCSDTQGRTANYEGKFVMAELRNWLLCFEYVPNRSLDKYITDASHGLEWRKHYGIIKGTCEGLLHLHEKRILHLDLKPGNILLDDHMVPKIADFGLSRCLDKEQTRASTSNPCGSMGYLAPESFGGKLTFASDIYSLGVIIVEILTGEKGYPEDEDVVDNWMNRLEASDQWEIQLEQVRVCTKIGIQCMDLDPKKRPVAHYIIDRLDKTASIIKTGITSSSVEQQVSFLKEACREENFPKLSSKYLGKDIRKNLVMEEEELTECVGITLREKECVEIIREYHWQQEQEEVIDDKLSLWGPHDTTQNLSPQGASCSSSNAGVLNKLDNFNSKAHMNYVKYGGPILENIERVKLFRIEELKPILKGDNFIGKGRFGEVYEGRVDNARLAIRKLISGTVPQKDQFVNEVIEQSKVCHRNIVKLIGICLDVDIPMLVYEFVSKGSLNDLLHSYHVVPVNLGVRLSIAAESAAGLAYLHSMGSKKILHGDVKPANILLGHNFQPKISDLGTSRMIAGDYGHTGRIAQHVGRMAGVVAYMDPVYLQTGLLTEQSDVYSFGVVILELISRRKATESNNNSLVRNFLENHKQGRKATKLFDKEIAVTGDLDLLDSLAEIAVECLDYDVEKRPRMVDVERRLSVLNQSRKP
ncbi:serine/threonine-protein kinase PLK1-like [Triticum dicoccoides]|uniref:serine/threonine-protein kinase PLK1-like n=1 Tax=Triticum dicoccoides TaxID=85692 RepID=UPI00189159C7|nr:serine/threonine-protein kinase PLK1-like [Triticum dicoccoides]